MHDSLQHAPGSRSHEWCPLEVARHERVSSAWEVLSRLFVSRRFRLAVWLFRFYCRLVYLFVSHVISNSFSRNEFVPVKEGKTFPHLVEVLLNLLVHLCRFSLSHNHNGYYLTTGAQGFKKFIQQVQSFFTPSEDEDVIPIPHTTFGLAPTIHGRTDPFHLSNAMVSHGIFTIWQVKSWGCCNDPKKDPEHANDDEKGQECKN